MTPADLLDPEKLDDAIRRLGLLVRSPRSFAKASVLLGVTVISIAVSIIATQAAVGLWGIYMERQTFWMIRAEIESLRLDVEKAPCSPQVRATAVQWNQRIEHEHESNRHWYSDWASTNKWMDVPRIEIPACP